MVGCGWKPVSFRIHPFRSEDDCASHWRMVKSLHSYQTWMSEQSLGISRFLLFLNTLSKCWIPWQVNSKAIQVNDKKVRRYIVVSCFFREKRSFSGSSLAPLNLPTFQLRSASPFHAPTSSFSVGEKHNKGRRRFGVSRVNQLRWGSNGKWYAAANSSDTSPEKNRRGKNQPIFRIDVSTMCK